MLAILKGIGILLLILLAIVLILLLLILLAPIRYRGQASFRERVFEGGACISWPAGIFRFTAEYDHKQLACSLKFLWLEIWGKPGKKKVKKKPKKKASDTAEREKTDSYDRQAMRPDVKCEAEQPVRQDASDTKESSVPVPEAEICESGKEPQVQICKRQESEAPVIHNDKMQETFSDTPESEKGEVKEKEHTRAENHHSEAEQNEKRPEGEEPEREGSAGGDPGKEESEEDPKDSLLKKLQNYWQRFESFKEDAENQKTIGLLKKQIGKLLKHILPRKLRIEGIIGFDDPDLTGRVLGWIYGLYPLYGEHIKVQGSFDKKELEGEAFLAGHIRLGTAAVIIIKVLMNRNFRQWIRKLKEVKNG